MIIPAEPIDQLTTRFDYSEREARFLWLVAHFSGHFTRPQYRRFAGVAPGKADDLLVSRLLSNGHATAYSWVWSNARKVSPQAQRLHLTHKAVYGSCGCIDSAHRRAAGLSLIAQRVAALDYVVDHWQPEDFLIGEHARISYFTNTHHIDLDALPARVYPGRNGRTTRVYFPDRYPTSVGHDGTVTFAYLDEPKSTLAPFHAHVRRYAPLFRALASPWRCVYVSARRSKRDAAEQIFHSALASDAPAQPRGNGDDDYDFVRYCQLQDRWLRKDLSDFSAADHIDRNMLEQRYSTPDHRARFDAWRESPERDTTPQTPTTRASNMPTIAPKHAPTFSTFIPQSLL